MNTEELSNAEQAELAAYEVRLILFEQISAQMKDLRLSQAELAVRLGVTEAYVTKLLRGQANLTINSLCKVAQALEMKYLPFLVSASGEANILDLDGDWQLRRLAKSRVPDAFNHEVFAGLDLGQEFSSTSSVAPHPLTTRSGLGMSFSAILATRGTPVPALQEALA